MKTPKSDPLSLKITKHAYKRAKKRLKLKRDAVDELAFNGLRYGIGRANAKGRLKKYLDKLYLKEKNANNIKIYKGIVFVFKDALLITIFPLPGGLTKYAEAQ